MSEEALMYGDPRATTSEVSVDQVFHASYRRLVVQLYGVVGDITEAEDLVQDAFVRAAAAGKRFLRVHNHEAWLRTTAINLHRNRWRKLKNFTKVRDRLAEEPTDLAGIDEHLTLMQALRELPDSQREVIALHYLADLPVAEVAETLRCPENTVKTRLRRARAALAVTLERSIEMNRAIFDENYAGEPVTQAEVEEFADMWKSLREEYVASVTEN